jgi:hypothetical protein
MATMHGYEDVSRPLDYPPCFIHKFSADLSVSLVLVRADNSTCHSTIRSKDDLYCSIMCYPHFSNYLVRKYRVGN